MIEIGPARGDVDFDDARALAWEFVAFLRERYPEMNSQIDDYLRAQNFKAMLADFASHFNPPEGECILARRDGIAAGIVMLKPVTDEICEMNRMFVRPQARGGGIGRRLCQALIAEAVSLGYSAMRLSALYRHDEALPLYRSLGFRPCDPFKGHQNNKDDRVVFMALDLAVPLP